MMDGFAIRSRGAHLPDHVRRLECISDPASSPRSPCSISATSNTAPRTERTRATGTSFRPLAVPQFARDIASRVPLADSTNPRVSAQSSASPATGARADREFANAFGNLSVWVDAHVRKCVFHAGFDKARVYLVFLQCLLDEIAPQDDEVQRSMHDLDAYIQYLSTASTSVGSDSSESDNRHARVALQSPRASGSSSLRYHALSPRPVPALRLDRLSSKANFPTAALVPQLLQQRSPRLTRSSQSGRLHRQHQQQQHLVSPPVKKIVQMSDHEERILELALYFDETLRSANKGAKDARSEFTAQWLLLTTTERHRVLRQRKRQLARQTFFLCSAAASAASSRSVEAATAKHTQLSNGLELIDALTTARAAAAAVPGSSKGSSDDSCASNKMELASYFSLVLLCLHDALQRVGVFSLELADFASKVLCDDTLALCDAMFATILAAQHAAAQQLQARKAAKAALQQQIVDLEAEILRLQTQNMRSLEMCSLEQHELAHLEREEQWHGHCKALVIDCIAHLQDTMHTPAWLQASPLPDSVLERDDPFAPSLVTGNSSHSAGQSDYQRLAPGFAAFAFHARLQVEYIAHLALLCRSYLHLHERRGVRDVLNSTAITQAASTASDSVADTHNQSIGADDWPLHGTPDVGGAGSYFLPTTGGSSGNNNPMERISLSELHTLRELNDALRAIEVLYAETGATSAGSGAMKASNKLTLRCPRPQTRSVGTQFPVMGANSARSFLRSLSYCTIAATTISSAPSSSLGFLPAGASVKLQAEIQAHRENVIVAAPSGSGRRRSSVRFKATAADGGSVNQPPPQIRLNKAVLKLPRHIRELLVLPLVRSNTAGRDASEDGASVFPADAPSSIAPCLSAREAVDKIHWVYRLALDNAYTSSSSSTSSAEMLAVSLHSVSQATGVWGTANFVEFIYASLLDSAGGDLERCEREFVQFFASIQLCLASITLPPGVSASIASSSSASTGGNGPGGALPPTMSEALVLFGLLTQLVHLQRTERTGGSSSGARVTRSALPFQAVSPLPSRVFPVAFYVQRVLLHVAVSRKQIESSGFSLDVWTLASADEVNSWGRSSPLAATAAAGASAQSKRATAAANSLYVLLESVKVLLLHVASFALVPDVSALLDERYQFLLDKSLLVTVALLTPVTPGAYTLSTPSVAMASGTAPNGQLAEAQVVPMDLAVATIVRAWLDMHSDVEHRVGITLRGALMDSADKLLFDEFVHVMTAPVVAAAATQQHHHFDLSNGSATGGSSSSGASATVVGGLSHARLAQIYADAQATEACSTRDAAMSRHGVHWTSLLRAVVDRVDIMGMHERFSSVDFRSIQQALLAPNSMIASSHSAMGGAFASAWLLGSANRGGATTQALIKSWRLHHATMREHITLAFQADSALDGVRSWQTGTLRLERVEALLQHRAVERGRSSWQRQKAKTKALESPRRVSSSSNTSAPVDPTDIAALPVDKDKDKDKVRSELRTSAEDKSASVELEPEVLSVAWKAYQLLQWDHVRAHQFADQVHLKQQRMQTTLAATAPTTASSAALAPGAAPAAKTDEVRPQRPAPGAAGGGGHHQRLHRT